MTRRDLVTMLVLIAALPALAQVYRWTDKDGKVHYSSQKPPEVEAATLKIDAPAPAAAPGTGAAAAAPAAAPTTAPVAAPGPNDAVAQQLAALDQQRCNAAKAVATRYETAPYLQAKDADGNMRKLSVEEEAAERIKVANDVAKLCGGK